MIMLAVALMLKTQSVCARACELGALLRNLALSLQHGSHLARPVLLLSVR